MGCLTRYRGGKGAAMISSTKLRGKKCGDSVPKLGGGFEVDVHGVDGFGSLNACFHFSGLEQRNLWRSGRWRVRLQPRG